MFNKFFSNLNLVLAVGLALAIGVMLCYQEIEPITVNTLFHWLHVFFGILWIGLLYYLNFVQVPTMPQIPAELKKGVTGYIAPNVLFYFRYGALLTVITGLTIAWNAGYVHRALIFQGASRAENMIGLGMDLALIMAFNVWFIIWPAQKKILGIVEASDEAKAAAGPRALYASRINVLLSLPMLWCMANANINA